MAANVAACSHALAVEPLPLAAMAASFGPPARVRRGPVRACTAAGQQRSQRAAAAHAQPVRLLERCKQVHTGQRRYEHEAGAVWRW